MDTDRRTFLGAGLAAAGSLIVAPEKLMAAGPGAVEPSGGVEPARGETPSLLILGGTGFLGPYQVHTALERGYAVSIFNRGRTEPRMFAAEFDRVEKLVGNLNGDLGALEGRRWDVVIDNSTRRSDWTRATTELLQDSGMYTFTSATGVYYPYLSADISEDAEVVMEDTRGGEDGPMAYAVEKAKSEAAVREVFGGRGLVLRPGHIVGPGDNRGRFPYWTTRIERGGEVAVPGPQDPIQFVDVRDLIDFTFRLVELENGGTFNVLGPASPMTMEGFAHGLRACASAPVTFVWMDDHQWLAEHGIDFVIPWILPLGDEMGHMRVSNARALAAGLTLRPLARTIMDVMAWWRSDAVPDEVRDGIRFPLTPEREAELVAAWRGRADPP
jgi:2'-hydroxyisoflavone reductase